MAMFMATSSGRGTPKWVHLRRIPLQDDPRRWCLATILSTRKNTTLVVQGLCSVHNTL